MSLPQRAKRDSAMSEEHPSQEESRAAPPSDEELVEQLAKEIALYTESRSSGVAGPLAAEVREELAGIAGLALGAPLAGTLDALDRPPQVEASPKSLPAPSPDTPVEEVARGGRRARAADRAHTQDRASTPAQTTPQGHESPGPRARSARAGRSTRARSACERRSIRAHPRAGFRVSYSSPNPPSDASSCAAF